MRAPIFRKTRKTLCPSNSERGITMVLVAVAMVAIIAMAALSIDIITLYLAREEAQRSADSAALAAARILSVSGLTGDPTNSSGYWGMICAPDDGTHGLAGRAAEAVVAQNAVGNLPAATVNVTYSAPGGSPVADCTSLTTTSFNVNPLVTVQIQQTSLPTFFSRIWGGAANTVSASATAEAYNPSNSSNAGLSTVTPVQPRCVKPFVVPNQDPLHPPPGAGGYCTGAGSCDKIVDLTTGALVHPGISLGGAGTGGIIGETFWLSPDCRWSQNPCTMRINPPRANYNNGSGYMKGPPNLVFAPAEVGTTTPIAVPSCGTGGAFEEAIAGCDSPQNYSCGLPPSSGGTNAVDFSISPDPDSAISNGVACRIHQGDTTTYATLSGQDYLSNPPVPAAPASYPFEIFGGSSNPIGAAVSGKPVSSSSSIVSLPIYDEGTPVSSSTATPVTFVGFLQVFINSVDDYGNINITVLNVTGCGNNASGTAVAGTSPVPVRLITP